MSRKQGTSNLGKSLVKNKRSRESGKFSSTHSSNLNDGYDWGCLQSITEQSQLDEFLLLAEKSANEYAAEKLNIVFVNPMAHSGGQTCEDQMILGLHEKYKTGLQIPRRPCWDKSITAEELNEKETESFLEWRRRLAEIEEINGLVLTPFEKNLEFWRQLWRVVEKSEIVVQVLDARNPLLYRCEDLEKYVKEVDSKKMNLLLLNKGDLLTSTQRCHWDKFFHDVDIPAVFYSAKQEQVHSTAVSNADINELTHSECPAKILSRQELLQYIRRFKDSYFPKQDFITIGMVGYPNVGKSSTINSLLDKKRLPVSATPGKTKHFQTFFVEPDICLCDCPGLVMPSFAVSKADLLLNGILPVDQMVDYHSAINLIVYRFPCYVLESTYGISIPLPENESSNTTPTIEQFLNAHGYMRGFMTQRGLPDNSRSARCILKDYIQGKLLYCHSPPDVVQDAFHVFPPHASFEKLPNFTPQQLKINKDKITVKELDEDFAKQLNVQAHGKGIGLEGGITTRISSQTVGLDPNTKPWKKQKKPKKEKLRRKFAHLDQ